MDIENIRLIFPDGGIVDEGGTMMVGANHLAESSNGNQTFCGQSTLGTSDYCWSYYDPDPTDYESYQECLLENVECDECEEALRKAIHT
jgi:hypothetical protein